MMQLDVHISSHRLPSSGGMHQPHTIIPSLIVNTLYSVVAHIWFAKSEIRHNNALEDVAKSECLELHYTLTRYTHFL